MIRKAKNNMKHKIGQQGMSLVELMIALLIGLLLSAAIITVYLSNKKTFWDTEAAASLQENSRFAMKLIVNDLRLAGFYGGIDHKVINKDSAVVVKSETGVSCKRGTDATPTEFEYERSVWVARKGANFPDCIGAKVSASAGAIGSDVLFVKHVSPEPHDFDAAGDAAKTKNTRSYIVAALDHAGHFNGENNTNLKDKIELSGDFPDGEVWEYVYHAYYISKPASDAFPQLRRRKLVVDPDNSSKSYWITETVAEGIEDIYFEFGIDTDNDGAVEAYVTPAKIDSNSYKWEEVIAAKVYLLAQATKSDLSFKDTKTYTYGVDEDRVYTPDSTSWRYHRKLYETTVTLFNNQMERVRGLSNE